MNIRFELPLTSRSVHVDHLVQLFLLLFWQIEIVGFRNPHFLRKAV